MNTCILHQRFLRESEKTLQPQTPRVKEGLGMMSQSYAHEIGIGGGVNRTELQWLSDRERIGTYERRPIAGLIQHENC